MTRTDSKVIEIDSDYATFNSGIAKAALTAEAARLIASQNLVEDQRVEALLRQHDIGVKIHPHEEPPLDDVWLPRAPKVPAKEYRSNGGRERARRLKRVKS